MQSIEENYYTQITVTTANHTSKDIVRLYLERIKDYQRYIFTFMLDSNNNIDIDIDIDIYINISINP